jgi:uncharacterized repeat protein (TIGR01451 family)
LVTRIGGDDGDELLEAGETWTYQGTYLMQPDDPDALRNVASVTGEDRDGDVVSAQDDHVVDGDFDPAITVAKDGPPAASIGAAVTYTFTVANDDSVGDGSPLSAVSVNDSLSGAASYVSGDDGDNLLEVGESWIFTATYTVKPDDSDPLTNIATATARDGDGDLFTAQDVHSADVDYAPSIRIEKNGPVSASRGETIAYTFVVTNDLSSGDGSAIESVSVMDSLADTAYVSGDDGDGLLEIGEAWIFEATYTIPDVGPAAITNVAVASGEDQDGDPLSDQDDHTLQIAADVSVSKIGSPSPVLPGGQLTYTIVVTNFGPEKAENVVLDDFIPLSLLGPEASIDAGASWNSWSGSVALGTLEVNESRPLLVRGTVLENAIAPLINQAEVTSGTFDPDLTNNTATDLTSIERLADLAITKSDDPDPIVSGEIVTYIIEVANNGPIAAPDVEVIETIPPYANWVDIVPSAGTYDPVTSTWSVGTLAVGEIETLELIVQVDPGYVGPLRNTARVGSPIEDPNPTNDVDEEVTTVLSELGGGGVADPEALPCERVEAVADRLWFVTDEAMYASWEFLQLAETADLLALDSETLLPTWTRDFAVDGVDVATGNLLQIHAGSGLGLPLSQAPRIVDRGLEETLNRFADLAGLGSGDRPENEQWIAIEYAAGDPRFRTRDDDLWPGGSWTEIDDSIDPSALGMSLLHQVRQIDRLTASSVPLDRYVGLVLSEIVAIKLIVFDEILALETPSEVGRAVVSEYRATDGEPWQIEPISTDYALFDHVSVLLGLAEFIPLAGSPEGEDLFSVSDLARAEQLLADLLEGTKALFHSDSGVLGTWTPSGGDPASIRDAGLLLLSLVRTADIGNPTTAATASKWVLELSDWLLAQQDASGGFPERTSRTGLQDTFTLADQSAAVLGLLAAFERTADRRTLEAAQRTIGFMNESLWDDLYGVYARSIRAGELAYCYRPLEVGLVIGAARRLLQVTESDVGTDAFARASRFFRAIVRDAGLHLENAQAVGTYGSFSGSGFGEIAPLQWGDAPRGVAPVLQSNLCIEARPATGPCCGIQVASEPWFQTDIAMFASYELQRSSLGQEDAADATLSNVVLHTGLGVPDEMGPWFVEQATTQRMPSERFTSDRWEQYVSSSGLDPARTPEISPIVLEFVSGSPRRPAAESLAWDDTTFFRRIEGAAIGMTLLREAQEAAQLLSTHRGDLYGQTPAEGFYGLLLAGAIQNKITFLTDVVDTMLAQGGEAYVPHAVRLLVENGGIRYEVLDGSSRLFDLTALLLGLREAGAFLRDPAFARLVGDGFVDAEAARDVDRLLGVVLEAIERRHLATGPDAFYERAEPLGGTWERAEPASLSTLGLLASALGTVPSESNIAVLQGIVFEAVRAFDPISAGSPLIDEFGLIGGLLAAHAMSARPEDLDGAQQAFDRSVNTFPITAPNGCGGTEGVPVSTAFRSGCATPLDLGLAIRVLEDLASRSSDDRARGIRSWLKSFVNFVSDELRLVLPEIDWRTPIEAGTTGPDRTAYAPVLARETCYALRVEP